MDEGQRRKAENEALFREVNERIERLHHHFAATEREPLDIVCECDKIDCTEQLRVPPTVYERVRSDARCFFVSPAHEDPQVEDVIDSGGNYVIVRKRPGEPTTFAAETDPRS
jgi:hypothetical protein